MNEFKPEMTNNPWGRLVAKETLTKMIKDGTYMKDDVMNPEVNTILSHVGLQIGPAIADKKRNSAGIGDAITAIIRQLEDEVAN